MIRFHLESQMSSSCLCPISSFLFFVFRASGWCGELAEQVRTWEGDIYHPLHYRAVTLPVWKSFGPSVEKKKKSVAIELHEQHRYGLTALVFKFWVTKTWMHGLHINLIILMFFSCIYFYTHCLSWRCISFWFLLSPLKSHICSVNSFKLAQ